MSILRPLKGLEILGGGRGLESQRKCMKQLEFPEGLGVLRKIPFCVGGLDNTVKTSE